MTVLSLALLGEPRLSGPDGAEITVPSRKSMALLAYLAANRGRSASRERIMGLLWGDRFDQQARQSLRQTLYSLRKLLGPDGENALSVAGDTVSLNASSVRTKEAFSETVSPATDSASSPSGPSSLRRL